MKSVKNWTKEDAVSFIEACMIWIGEGFHPDTPMADYVALGNGQPTFTSNEAVYNQERLNRAFELLGDDIYECGMELGRKLGYYPAPDPEKVTLYVIYGNSAAERFEEMDANDPIEGRLDMACEEDGEWKEFTFDTQAELDSFIKGMDEIDKETGEFCEHWCYQNK